MPPTTSFRHRSDLRAYARNSLGEQDKAEFAAFHARLGRGAPRQAPGEAANGAAAVFLAGRTFWRISHCLRPASRFLLQHSAPILKIAAVGLAFLAAAGFLAQRPRTGTAPEGSPARTAATPAPRRPTWVEISKPLQFYDLPAPLVAGKKLDYEARRHSTGGGREDYLTFGQFAGKEPFVRLGVYRYGTENIAAPPFFVDMARRAAAIGVSIDRADAPGAQATRFGDFETAAMTMREGGLARDNCRGFRYRAAPPGLSIAGFACAGGDKPFTGAELACLIDRLDLLAAGGDKPLRDFFAAAEGRGAPDCAE